ncbi:MAG: glycosyl hydrolase family 8 [Terrimicrobiaceae bacterium]
MSAEDEGPRPIAAEALGALHGFVEGQMTESNGAVFVNAVTDRLSIAGEARNRDILSETVGQRMELALLENDPAAFARQLDLIKAFQGKTGLLAWKMHQNPAWKAADSATIDDWRIAAACLRAAKLWKLEGAEEAAGNIARAILKFQTPARLFPVAIGIDIANTSRDPIPLCYLMPGAILRLSGHVPELREAAEAAFQVATGGRIHPGLPAQRYDPEAGQWMHGRSDEVLALLTLLEIQLVDARNPGIQEAIQIRLKRLAEFRHLPESWDSATGEPSASPAGAAVYACFLRLLIRDGRLAEAAEPLKLMLEFQNKEGRFQGAIGGAPVYSFDQLEVMLTLAEFVAAKDHGMPEGAQ